MMQEGTGYAQQTKTNYGKSNFAQDVASIEMWTGNRPHDEQSQAKCNELFSKEVHARSIWGLKAQRLKKAYKRLLGVPDWRDPSKTAKYNSTVHRWNNDKTCRERQRAQCLWTRDSAIMYDAYIKTCKRLSKENFANPEVTFSWQYRQTDEFRKRYRPEKIVQKRGGGSATFSHRFAPTAAQHGRVGTRPEIALVNFEAGAKPPSSAGGDPRPCNTSEPKEARPGQSDEQYARELSDRQYALELQRHEDRGRRDRSNARSSAADHRWDDLAAMEDHYRQRHTDRQTSSASTGTPVGGDFSANAWSHQRDPWSGVCWNCRYPEHLAKDCPALG